MTVKKDIVGYEGYYYITPEGKVFSYDRKITAKGLKPGTRLRKGKQLSSYQHNINKLEAVQLFKGNKRKIFYVHKIMSAAYFDNQPVQHIDNNPMNNNILNLKLCQK